MKNTFKKVFSVFLVLLMCITSAPLTGVDFSVTAKAATSGYYTYTVSNGEATITDVADTPSNANLSVPDTLGGYPVTTIGTHAFYGCNDIDSLSFGNNITTFEERAFSNSIIESMTIGTGLETIAADAFYDCYYLENIEVNKYNPNFSSDEYGVLFNKDKTNLIKYTCGNTRKSYTIPDSVTTIGEASFHMSSYLESVTIPESVILINKEAFSSCNNLTDVYYGGTEEQWAEISIDSYNEPLTSATIHFAECNHNYVDGICSGCDDIQIIASGKWDSVTWILYGTGLLNIDGEGEISNHTSNNRPWENHTDIVKTVVIGNKVTAIGDTTFHDHVNLSSVTIGSSVTKIGEWAFAYCESLEDIAIGKFITTIGYSAFFGCNNLKSVTIGNNVETIGARAFYACDNLVSVAIGDSVTTIGDSAFHSCTSLKNVTIPESVTTIQDFVFAGCTSLEFITVAENNVNYCNDEFGVLFNKNKTILIQYPVGNAQGEYEIPNTVKHIGSFAFKCATLTNITVPEGITYVYPSAFSLCNNLTDVYYGGTEEQWNQINISSNNEPLTNATIHFAECTHEYQFGKCIHCGQWKETAVYGECGDDLNWVLDTETGVLYIGGSGAMYDYTYTEGDCPWINYVDDIRAVVIGDGVTTIGAEAFAWCTFLSNVTIPDSVTSIGYKAFDGCQSIKNINIPNSVTTIGDYAFKYCTYLASITIPESVTTIGEGAFSQCYRLTSITVDENNQSYSNDSLGVLYNKDKTEIIKHPEGSKRTEFVIPESVTTIGESAFNYCSKLTNITIPESVTTIGDGAFFGCESLTSIVIPNGITIIPIIAFANCYKLESVTIPESVITIEADAFGDCTSLKSVIIPEGVTTIETWAFERCSSLESVTIPESVTTIGASVFRDCEKLTDIYYIGSQELWNKIDIDSYNYELNNAVIHYNYCSVNENFVHSYTSKITTPATHLKEGTKTFTCSACGYSYNEAIAKLQGHTYEKVVTKPTCTSRGYTTYTCACGYSYVSDYKDVLDHDYTSEITTQPTHLTEGVETFTCIACGDTYTETVAKLTKHTYKSVVTAPTCTAKGFTTYTCECGYSYTGDYTDKLAHEYTSEIITEPTHLKEGSEKLTCRVCGDNYIGTIAKLEGHTYKSVVTDPTCTDRGYTTYTCECGYSYNGNYVGSKGHNYSSVITKQPTHLKEGTNTFTCSVCGDSYKEDIAKLPDHTYTVKGVTAPTCTAQGYTTFVCACGDTYKADYVPATGHSDNNADGICDSCGRNLNTNPASCSHMCHKGGLMGFIWKIISFFFKLIGSNKTCTCGVAHY